jgi:hypothetical protein
MRTPRKTRGGSKKGRDTDPSREEAGSEYHEPGQPNVTSYLLDMDLRAIKAHLRHILRRFRARKKGK